MMHHCNFRYFRCNYWVSYFAIHDRRLIKSVIDLHFKLIYVFTTSTIADARHQEENPMRKKCLNAIVQEGHNICTSEWEMPSAILKANTV